KSSSACRGVILTSGWSVSGGFAGGGTGCVGCWVCACAGAGSFAHKGNAQMAPSSTIHDSDLRTRQGSIPTLFIPFECIRSPIVAWMNENAVNLWTSSEHVKDYLQRADLIAHRGEGEAALLEFVPEETRRILDLGTGDGRLLALVRAQHPDTEAVAVDFSPAMLAAAQKRFGADGSVRIVEHNLDEPLPALGKFDAVISSFAIHHLVHERKQALYGEIFGLLNTGGVFCNLEHVSSPSQQLHEEFLQRIGFTVE